MNCLNNGNWWLEELMTEKNPYQSRIQHTPYDALGRIHQGEMTAEEKRTPSVENFSVPHNTHYWIFPLRNMHVHLFNTITKLWLCIRSNKRPQESLSLQSVILTHDCIIQMWQWDKKCICCACVSVCVYVYRERERIKSLTVISLFEEFYKCY